MEWKFKKKWQRSVFSDWRVLSDLNFKPLTNSECKESFIWESSSQTRGKITEVKGRRQFIHLYISVCVCLRVCVSSVLIIIDSHGESYQLSHEVTWLTCGSTCSRMMSAHDDAPYLSRERHDMTPVTWPERTHGNQRSFQWNVWQQTTTSF